MATRIKDWIIPYTWWTGIEITANHVINVLLRDENNLIQVNDDSELYVDLQLVDWIEPDDDFPVWVTTGKILEEDWWSQSWIILNWKTTSGDYNRWIYANDTHLYFDPWTWVWQRIMTATEIYELLEEIHVQLVYDWKLTIKENWVIKWEFYANQQWDTVVELSGGGLASNTQTFFLTSLQDLVNAQAGYDWYLAGNEALFSYTDWIWNDVFVLSSINSTTNKLSFKSTRWWIRNRPALGYSELVWKVLEITVDPLTNQVTAMSINDVVWADWFITIWGYNNAFTPTNDSDPATKKYVDDQISSIQPWPTYTAWAGINIDSNNEISNTLPFDPNNQWQVWQVIKKTADWYEWANESWGWTIYYWGTGITIDWNNYISNDWVLTINGNAPDQNGNINVSWTNYTAWDWININSSDVISNSKPFDPDNSWNTGQVLKKTNNGYEWANESWEWVPSWGTVWQVLTKTNNWYDWANIEIPSGENNVKFWNIDSANMTSAVEEEIMDWVTASPNNWAILNDESTNRRDVYIYDHTTTVWQSTSCIFFWVNRNTEKHTDNAWYDYTVWYQRRLTIATDGSTYSTIVDENPDPLTHTNYLSVTTTSGYSAANAFIPTEDYQPTTKKYVDSVVTWWWIPYTAWNWISIINNVISNTWVLSGDSWVTYTIKVSNSDPSAWTPNNVITLVL